MYIHDVWHNVCKSLGTVSLVVNNRVMVPGESPQKAALPVSSYPEYLFIRRMRSLFNCST